MKVKRVLRFYFSADSLNRAIDNVILNAACASMGSYGVSNGVEKIGNLVCEKQELSKLWRYLDGVISSLCKEDISSLNDYAALRCGIKSIDDNKRREIKRAVIKFTRRARRLESFSDALELVGKYYCLLNV